MLDDKSRDDIERMWDEAESGMVLESYVCYEDFVGVKAVGILDIVKVDDEDVGEVIPTTIEFEDRNEPENVFEAALDANKDLLEENDG